MQDELYKAEYLYFAITIRISTERRYARKKTEQLAYRLTEEEKQAITGISEEFRLKPQNKTLASTIISLFCYL